MSTIDNFADVESTGVGIGALPPRRRRRRGRGRSTRRRRPSHVFSSEPATTDGGSSFGLSDSDAQSSARLDSSVAGDECGSSGIFSYNHSRMESSSDEIDLESGELEMKVHSSGKNEKQCRICHLNFEVGSGDQAEDEDDGGGGDAIELGCNCKGDLGTAHKHCAETWFKIRGNILRLGLRKNMWAQDAKLEKLKLRLTSPKTHGTTDIEAGERAGNTAMAVGSETQSFWQGRRIMNILLGCMVFAFIISWLFHFNVLP
ncbi:Zinc finger, RING-CH-type [Cynara cardunculus var. scolymus]|uniref:Zinc finger, RING-CH-type n=1 Tax=Cynara cardunculus var. scolymus TaxID=59895 RepID=A0A103Y6Z1_CYNCS|nr:Zinc finger, RING-CH-type [Cynara cardunculus var. scolymus]